jgi:hypothetical protein
MDDDTHTKEESTQSLFLVFRKINLTDKMMREREREEEEVAAAAASRNGSHKEPLLF